MRSAIPDEGRSIESYRRVAGGYDASCTRTMSLREEAVALLNLQRGDVVVDVASGTGTSFPLLMKAIGPAGHLIAIEHSPDMMARARRRVEEAGWRNVTLIEGKVGRVRLPVAADALFLHFTHDVVQSPASLDALFSGAKPGARVVVAGVRLLPWWLAPVNLWIMFRARHYLTTHAGLRQPWRNVLKHVPDLVVRPRLLGTAYVAHGRYRPAREARTTDGREGQGGSRATGTPPGTPSRNGIDSIPASLEHVEGSRKSGMPITMPS